MVQRQVGEALAVEAHTRGLEAADQLAVRQAVQPRGGVDADHPQPAEIALLAATAGVGVIERLVHGLLGRLIQLALGGVEAFRTLQQLLPLGAANGSSFYAGHWVSTPSMIVVTGELGNGGTGEREGEGFSSSVPVVRRSRRLVSRTAASGAA